MRRSEASSQCALLVSWSRPTCDGLRPRTIAPNASDFVTNDLLTRPHDNRIGMVGVGPVSEVSEPDIVISAATLRTAIRAKVRAGTDRQTITLLIGKYVPSTRNTMRLSDGVYRLPVEMIPLSRRTAFLDALKELPSQRPSEATGIALNFGCV
jgi:hypothetical protein